MPIAGLGPHGERGAPSEQLDLSPADTNLARQNGYRVAVVLHTMASDWAKQELKGITSTLDLYGATLTEVVDCAFRIDTQTQTLERLIRTAPDAIISIPIGGSVVADAHRRVSRAGIKLVLLDNGPTGLMPGTDYVSVISADNFGLGTIGAQLLSPHVSVHGKVGVLSYQADFFATNEREIAFRKWMAGNRPDIQLKSIKFADVGSVAAALDPFLDRHPDIAGLFAVWDVPAMVAVRILRARARDVSITTIDLGNQVASALACGDIIKGVGAQRAYDQGVAAAKATIASLLGRDPPSWVVLPGLAATPDNVAEAYQRIWYEAPPAPLLNTRPL